MTDCLPLLKLGAMQSAWKRSPFILHTITRLAPVPLTSTEHSSLQHTFSQSLTVQCNLSLHQLTLFAALLSPTKGLTTARQHLMPTLLSARRTVDWETELVRVSFTFSVILLRDSMRDSLSSSTESLRSSSSSAVNFLGPPHLGLFSTLPVSLNLVIMCRTVE